MANIQDALNKIAALKANNDALLAKVTTLENELTNVINRLLAKIVSISDTQPIIDAIAPIDQAIVDATPKVDSAIAQAQVEGQ